jgi:TfoX/Sxy family transcriptional regulator of competence genes
MPSDPFALYDKLIKTNPNLERKGVKLPYTSFNGHMFSFLSETGVVAIRLPKEEREAFLKKYATTLMESHGAIMKEYAAVPENLLKKTNELKKFLDISYEYVKTLKPKPQKKSK